MASTSFFDGDEWSTWGAVFLDGVDASSFLDDGGGLALGRQVGVLPVVVLYC